MRILFETLQALGVIGAIVGLGWFMGMVVGWSVEGKVSVWLVVGPLFASLFALAIGAILEVAYDAGIKSELRQSLTSKKEESE